MTHSDQKTIDDAKALVREDYLCTSEIRPPIGTLAFDWVAHLYSADESGPFGFGETEADAILDLEEQLNG